MSLNETQEILQRFKPYSSSFNGLAKGLENFTAGLSKNKSDPLSAQLTSCKSKLENFKSFYRYIRIYLLYKKL